MSCIIPGSDLGKSRKKSLSPACPLSVIVCTRNRAPYLSVTVASLIEQVKRHSSELLIIDNNSEDSTRETTFSYAEANREVRYYFEERIGTSYARNRGILEARGELLVFTDDDCVASENWLDAILEAFRAHTPDAVGGPVLPLNESFIPKWLCSNLDIFWGPLAWYDLGAQSMRLRPNDALPVGGNMAFTRECIDRFGEFRVDVGPGAGSSGEDTEYFERLLQGGASVWYSGKAVVRHDLPLERTRISEIAKWYMKKIRGYFQIRRPRGLAAVRLGYSLFIITLRKAAKLCIRTISISRNLKEP